MKHVTEDEVLVRLLRIKSGLPVTFAETIKVHQSTRYRDNPLWYAVGPVYPSGVETSWFDVYVGRGGPLLLKIMVEKACEQVGMKYK